VGRPGWRALFFGFCLFVIYGTLIPFDATRDLGQARHHLEKFWQPPFEHGRRTFSIADVISNVALFVPLGFSWVAWRRSPAPRSASLILQSGGIGLFLGSAAEALQLFTPTRTASSLDLLANTGGAVLGGLAAALFFSSGTNREIKRYIQARPHAVLLALLAAALMADSFYPYAATLDMSTIRAAVKQIRWPTAQEIGERFRRGIIAEQFFFFSLIALLLRHLLRDWPASRLLRSVTAVALTGVFALWLEASKILFVGRVPNLTNPTLALIGAAGALVFFSPARESRTDRSSTTRWLLGVITLLIIIMELAPFDWSLSLESVRAKGARIEWLPFWSYYATDAASAAFDIGKKLLYLGTFGFLVAARRSERRGDPVSEASPVAEVVATAVGLGVILESAQLLLPSRTPSTTDVLLFGLGAAAGGLGYRLYRKLLMPSP